MSKALELTFYLLSNASGVTNLVSQGSITPQRIIGGTDDPYITFRRVSDVPWMTDDSDPARMARVQINIYSKNQDTATAIETQIIAAMNRVTPGVYGGNTLICSTYDGSFDLSEDGADSDGFFHVAADFLINYSNG